MRVKGAKKFSLWYPHERQIKRMALRQIQRLRFTSKRNRNVLGNPAKLSFRRFLFLFGNVFEIYFPHRDNVCVTTGTISNCHSERSEESSYFRNSCHFAKSERAGHFRNRLESHKGGSSWMFRFAQHNRTISSASGMKPVSWWRL